MRRLAPRRRRSSRSVPRMYEWLDLDGEAGQDYWAAMELCGRVRAGEPRGHPRGVREAERAKPVAVVAEPPQLRLARRRHVIHRKGATPAEAGVLGIIPGSMGTPRTSSSGSGNPDGLHERLARGGPARAARRAKDTITMHEVRACPGRARRPRPRASSVDESPLAYKDIERVLEISGRGRAAPAGRPDAAGRRDHGRRARRGLTWGCAPNSLFIGQWRRSRPHPP